MNPSEEQYQPGPGQSPGKRQKKPKKFSFPFKSLAGLFVLFLVVAAGATLYLSSLSDLSERSSVDQNDPGSPPQTHETLADTSQGLDAASSQGDTTLQGDSQPVDAPQSDSKQTDPDPLTLTESATTASPPGGTKADALASCASPTRQLSDFYHHLDVQPYMVQYGLPHSSKEHFEELIKKLLANPPQVTREADDLYAILKNTAHFFRVSGKDNILMMKGILEKEKDGLEGVLADYYHLVTTSDCSQTPHVNYIDKSALYEYACFFLNTMGGRLYLFRRDSRSRMVVTYYAIMLVDQANELNNNYHGIDIKPAVNMLIAEMEAGGNALQRGDYYLDKLYSLKEKYQDQ